MMITKEARDEIWFKCRTLWMAKSLTGEWYVGIPFKEYLIVDVDEFYGDDEVEASKFPDFDYIKIHPETLRSCSGLCDMNGILLFDGTRVSNGIHSAEVQVNPGEITLAYNKSLVTLRCSDHLEVVSSHEGGPSLDWMKIYADAEAWTKRLGGDI